MIKKLVVLIVSLSSLATYSGAQSRCLELGPGTLSGQTYSNPKLGLSYKFPAGYKPDDLRTLPKDTNSEILLYVWKNPRELPKPSIIIMADAPSSYSDPSAIGYFHRIENTFRGSAKILNRNLNYDLSGIGFYRLDYEFPGLSYNTAITGQIDGCQISFQFTASTPREIEELSKSMETVKIVRRKVGSTKK